MKKLRLATVFSGIGAIEHAIERLNIPYEIVFASDNGEIELKQTEEEIKAELDDLKDDIEKKQYIDDLYKDSGRINFVQKSYFANYDISEDKFYQDVRFINGYQFRGRWIYLSAEVLAKVFLWLGSVADSMILVVLFFMNLPGS